MVSLYVGICGLAVSCIAGFKRIEMGKLQYELLRSLSTPFSDAKTCLVELLRPLLSSKSDARQRTACTQAILTLLKTETLLFRDAVRILTFRALALRQSELAKVLKMLPQREVKTVLKSGLLSMVQLNRFGQFEWSTSSGKAKANGLQSCVVIIRIMRDMCSRVPAFIPLNSWAMELLVEKALSSSSHPLGPGEAFRRVMECLSSGVLLEAGPGLSDPCEKESVDPTACMTAQEREDLTAAAQHALRLQAFRQLHKVLGVDPLPPPAKFRGRGLNRGGGRFKRRREDSGQGDEGAKKEKKEGEPEGEVAPASEGMEVAPGGEAKDAPGDKTEVKS